MRGCVMPYIDYKCIECGKLVSCHRSLNVIKTSGIPKYCSFGCRDGGLPGFSWKNSTQEEIKAHLQILFNNKVVISEGCWEWNGPVDRDGYGKLSVKNRIFGRAHRVSWFLRYGKIPTGLICHTCPNKDCTNPLHLFVGDPKDNSRDMVEKNIQLKGSKNGASKLNEKQVEEIKKLLSKGNTCREIAESYNVHLTTIAKIRDNKTWSHIPYPDSTQKV
jgi:hypothetical protein